MYACHVLFLSSMQDALTLSVSFISYRIGSRLWEISNSLPVFDAENSRHNHNDQDLRGQLHGADPNNSACLDSSVHPIEITGMSKTTSVPSQVPSCAAN